MGDPCMLLQDRSERVRTLVDSTPGGMQAIIGNPDLLGQVLKDLNTDQALTVSMVRASTALLSWLQAFQGPDFSEPAQVSEARFGVRYPQDRGSKYGKGGSSTRCVSPHVNMQTFAHKLPHRGICMHVRAFWHMPASYDQRVAWVCR